MKLNLLIIQNSTAKFLKGFLVATIISCLSMASMDAQMKKGDFILGADIGSGFVPKASEGLFGLNFGLDEGAGFNVGISPRAGYFVSDRVLLGSTVNLGYNKSPEINGQAVETTIYGIQGLFRYYFRPADLAVDDAPKKGIFFLETNAGLNGFNVSGRNPQTGVVVGFGPGYALFISDNVALELTGKYRYGLAGGDINTFQQTLSLNVGVQIYLDKEKVKNIFKRN